VVAPQALFLPMFTKKKVLKNPNFQLCRARFQAQSL